MIFKSDSGKFKNALCVFIDDKNSNFEFYSTKNGDIFNASRETKPFTKLLFSADFLDELSNASKEYSSSHGDLSDTAVTLLVPDNAVALDTISIPNMGKRRNDDALDATLSGFYKNRNELSINTVFASQTKTTVTYSVSVMNEKTSKSLEAAMKEGGLTPTNITFVSNAKVNAVTEMNQKLKSSTYLLLDMKEYYSSFSFVSKGRTVGFYNLPFGHHILGRAKLYPEDMLFDHSIAELAVLNANEKARAKQLTVMQNDDEEDDFGEETQETEPQEENLDAIFGGDENATDDPTKGAKTFKTLPKKQPRKLPKFMLREDPTGEEGYSYENFRIFIKWALNLLASNDKLNYNGAPEAVYVNMPKELDYLYDMTNAEKEENGIEFKPLELSRADFSNDLELIGAVLSLQYNKNNNF